MAHLRKGAATRGRLRRAERPQRVATFSPCGCAASLRCMARRISRRAAGAKPGTWIVRRAVVVLGTSSSPAPLRHRHPAANSQATPDGLALGAGRGWMASSPTSRPHAWRLHHVTDPALSQRRLRSTPFHNVMPPIINRGNHRSARITNI